MQDIGLDDTEAEPSAQSGTEFIDIPAANTLHDTYGGIIPLCTNYMKQNWLAYLLHHQGH